MNTKTNELLTRIHGLELELQAELAKQSADLHYTLEHGRAIFEAEILRRHREMQVRLTKYIMGARPMVVVTAPFIYALIVPLVLLDIFVSVYQAVCFPTYGIEKAKRSDYLVFDRGHLAYLNALEKLNCAYCSYANGLLAYVHEIAGRTEAYWCPIKHARKTMGAHAKYTEFVAFGDAEAYRQRVEEIDASHKK